MEIHAFRGWRYSAPGGDVSRFIAPPYDVLSPADKQALLNQCPENIVAVDLPVVPAKEPGPDEVYRASAARLRDWMSRGLLTQEALPAIYAYEQTFSWAGKTYTRRAMLAGVRATPLGQDVIPHEHTFAGPKADRLKLTVETKTQISPIFGFYEDPAGQVVGSLFDGLCCPTNFGTLRGVSEKLWAITDAKVIAKVQAALRKVPVFIADGHHRYTTQLGYRDSLAKNGGLKSDDEANFIMFALVARDDSGMLILPTHRVVRGLKQDFSLQALRKATPEFEWKPLPLAGADLTDTNKWLSPLGPHAIAAVAGKEAYALVLKDEQAMRSAAPKEVDQWRKLDVSILQTLIMEKALSAWKTPQFAVDYTPDAAEAVSAAASSAQVSFCLQSTPLSAVEAIARAGAVMPHKSTYFYPKLATGMVLKPL